MTAPVFDHIDFANTDDPYAGGEGYVEKLDQLSTNFTTLGDYVAGVAFDITELHASLTASGAADRAVVEGLITSTTGILLAATQAERELAQAAALSSLNNSLAAAASAASIADYSARVQAILVTRGITNVKAIAFKSAAGWELTDNQWYKTEERPAGRNLGVYANATAAWSQTDTTPATAAGDWYWQTSGTIGLFECTTSNNSSQRYRAGSDHMPLECVFVFTTTNVYIFDLTDPLMPLWMQFIRSASTMYGEHSAPDFAGVTKTAFFNNDKLVYGTNSGSGGMSLRVIDFRADRAYYINSVRAFTFAGNIAQRNSALGTKTSTTATASILQNSNVNGVANFDRYIVAVTDSGLSTISDSGVVTRSATTNQFVSPVELNGRLYALNISTSPNQLQGFAPVAELSASFAYERVWSSAITPLLSASALTTLGKAKDSLIVISASAVDQLWPNPAVNADALIARRGTTYATPPTKKPEVMLICGTTEGSVADTPVMIDTFDSDIASWSNVSTGTGSATWDAGTALVTGSNASNRGVLRREITCVVGKEYRVLTNVSARASTTGMYVEPDSTFGGTRVTELTITTTGDLVSPVFTATQTSYYVYIFAGAAASSINVSSIEVEEVVADHSGLSNHATINGTLTATAEVAGGVAGLSGFTVNTNYLSSPNPLDGIGTGEAWIAGAFKCVTAGTDQMLVSFDYWDGAAYQDSIVRIYIDTSGRPTIYASSNAGVGSSIARGASSYADGLVHTFVVKKTGTIYYIYLDGILCDYSGTGHANLTFHASATARIGRTGEGATVAPNSTIWFAGAGNTALSDEEAALMHTHMRNLILNKASLDEIPTALAYNPTTKAVEMAGATYHQTLQDGAIVSSVAHGQGTTPAIAAGSRGEIAVGGTTGLSVDVPERNLREYQARKTTERFTVKYVGNATGSRVLFPLPTTAAEMLVTIGAKPVRVSNAGVVQTEGAAEDYTVKDYGLGRYVVQFAVAPADANDVVVEFERGVWK